MNVRIHASIHTSQNINIFIYFEFSSLRFEVSFIYIHSLVMFCFLSFSFNVLCVDQEYCVQ